MSTQFESSSEEEDLEENEDQFNQQQHQQQQQQISIESPSISLPSYPRASLSPSSSRTFLKSLSNPIITTGLDLNQSTSTLNSNLQSSPTRRYTSRFNNSNTNSSPTKLESQWTGQSSSSMERGNSWDDRMNRMNQNTDRESAMPGDAGAKLDEEVYHSRQKRLARQNRPQSQSRNYSTTTTSTSDSFSSDTSLPTNPLDSRDSLSARANILALASSSNSSNSNNNNGSAPSLASFMGGGVKAPRLHRIGTGPTEDEREVTERLEREMEATKARWSGKNVTGDGLGGSGGGVSLASLMKGNNEGGNEFRLGAGRWKPSQEVEQKDKESHSFTFGTSTNELSQRPSSQSSFEGVIVSTTPPVQHSPTFPNAFSTSPVRVRSPAKKAPPFVSPTAVEEEQEMTRSIPPPSTYEFKAPVLPISTKPELPKKKVTDSVLLESPLPSPPITQSTFNLPPPRSPSRSPTIINSTAFSRTAPTISNLEPPPTPPKNFTDRFTKTPPPPISIPTSSSFLNSLSPSASSIPRSPILDSTVTSSKSSPILSSTRSGAVIPPLSPARGIENSRVFRGQGLGIGFPSGSSPSSPTTSPSIPVVISRPVSPQVLPISPPKSTTRYVFNIPSTAPSTSNTISSSSLDPNSTTPTIIFDSHYSPIVTSKSLEPAFELTASPPKNRSPILTTPSLPSIATITKINSNEMPPPSIPIKSISIPNTGAQSLAAMFGSKATGPRLNKSNVEREEVEEENNDRPEHVRGGGGVALPGMVFGSKVVPRSKDETSEEIVGKSIRERSKSFASTDVLVSTSTSTFNSESVPTSTTSSPIITSNTTIEEAPIILEAKIVRRGSTRSGTPDPVRRTSNTAAAAAAAAKDVNKRSNSIGRATVTVGGSGSSTRMTTTPSLDRFQNSSASSSYSNSSSGSSSTASLNSLSNTTIIPSSTTSTTRPPFNRFGSSFDRSNESPSKFIEHLPRSNIPTTVGSNSISPTKKKSIVDIWGRDEPNISDGGVGSRNSPMRPDRNDTRPRSRYDYDSPMTTRTKSPTLAGITTFSSPAAALLPAHSYTANAKVKDSSSSEEDLKKNKRTEVEEENEIDIIMADRRMITSPQRERSNPLSRSNSASSIASLASNYEPRRGLESIKASPRMDNSSLPTVTSSIPTYNSTPTRAISIPNSTNPWASTTLRSTGRPLSQSLPPAASPSVPYRSRPVSISTTNKLVRRDTEDPPRSPMAGGSSSVKDAIAAWGSPASHSQLNNKVPANKQAFGIRTTMGIGGGGGGSSSTPVSRKTSYDTKLWNQPQQISPTTTNTNSGNTTPLIRTGSPWKIAAVLGLAGSTSPSSPTRTNPPSPSYASQSPFKRAADVTFSTSPKASKTPTLYAPPTPEKDPKPIIRTMIESDLLLLVQPLSRRRPFNTPRNQFTVEIFSITPRGTDLILNHEAIFYETEWLFIVTKSGNDQINGFVWKGREIKLDEESNTICGKMIGMLKMEHDCETVVQLEQGYEGSSLLEVLGGTLVVRQGDRKTFNPIDARLYSVQACDDGIVIAETIMACENVCSAYCSVLSLMGEVYVWIGRGSAGVEKHGAQSYAKKIAAGREITVLQEGGETEHFWHTLEGNTYASAHYWRFRPKLAYPTTLLSIDSTSEQLLSRSSTLLNSSVSIIDAGFEIWIIVPSQVSDNKEDLEVAVDACKKLVKSWKQRELLFRPAAHALFFPTALPRDLKHLSRKFDFEFLNNGTSAPRMNLYTLEEASSL